MFPALETTRFETETGFQLTVEVPEERADAVVEAIAGVVTLKYGDYDTVAFRSAPGSQQFRSLGTGRNAATGKVVAVPCQRVSCFLPETADSAAVMEAIYHVHPYEEPVILLVPALRTLHVRGLDEDNPNRFWNRPAADWVPEEHR
ncbi:MAG: hypothetical protein P1U88_17100 [Thalassobaculaceae bacterium]|nr:hypothetical protein [Thalassobaculaceae bacterium]